ncbi:MAG: DUF4258 domain-containing protein [Candidatus Woesearchaeota archaeon]
MLLFIVKYSGHARDRMKMRSISTQEVEKALACGSKELQKPDKIIIHFRYFCIICKKVGKIYYIITVKPR